MLVVRIIADHVNSIIRWLTGFSEESHVLSLTNTRNLLRCEIFKTLEMMSALSVQISTMLKESPLINVFLHLCKTRRMILQKVCLERFGTRTLQPLYKAQKYPCAFRGCPKKAGVWMPYSPGRGVRHLYKESYEGSIVCVDDGFSGSPQELIEDFEERCRRTAWNVDCADAVERVVVTCSVKCYCRVKAYLHSLGGDMFSNFYVIRGTKQVPKKLLEKLNESIRVRDDEHFKSNPVLAWRAEPGEYDEIIDRLDCEEEFELGQNSIYA